MLLFIHFKIVLQNVYGKTYTAESEEKTCYSICSVVPFVITKYFYKRAYQSYRTSFWSRLDTLT